jgi:hypothetical protein
MKRVQSITTTLGTNYWVGMKIEYTFDSTQLIPGYNRKKITAIKVVVKVPAFEWQEKETIKYLLMVDEEVMGEVMANVVGEVAYVFEAEKEISMPSFPKDRSTKNQEG